MSKRKLLSGFLSNHFCVSILSGLAFSALAIPAHATCTVTPISNVNMGTQSVVYLSNSTNPTDYKLVGIRDVVVSVSCDVNQSSFKISLTGLTPASDNLVFWNSTGSVTGALKFQATSAKVNGTTVGIKLQSAGAASYAPEVNFTSDDSVILDLTGFAPAVNKTSFSVNLHFTGLLSNNTPVTNQVNLLSNFNAEAVGSP